LQILSAFLSVSLCHESFLPHQKLISSSHLPLVQYSFDFPLLFSLYYYRLWHLFSLAVYLIYVPLNSSNVHYWAYPYCARQFQFHYISQYNIFYLVQSHKLFCECYEPPWTGLLTSGVGGCH